MQVQLINFAGVDEAGIDGGGLFREFIWELLKTAFDPNRGFFKYTTDRHLYPNHDAQVLNADFRSHYFFLGRILGKVVLLSGYFRKWFFYLVTQCGNVSRHCTKGCW